MTNYLERHLLRGVPQTEQENSLQVSNSAGGFSFTVKPEDQLMRFLILGAEGGTYYVEEKDLVKGNLDNLKDLTFRKPKFVVDLAARVSDEGRSYRNDAAIFALAYVMTFGRDEAKAYARSKVNVIVRTSYHLFQYISFLKSLAPGSGLGTSRNRSIANWYESKSPEDLAYQAVKYRQRLNWSHRDAFRQSRPKDINSSVAGFVMGKEHAAYDDLRIIDGFKTVQKAENVKQVLEALEFWKMLPWESLPTQFHKSPEVWKTLFHNGQLKGQALVRNITRLARIGAFDDMVFAREYANALVDEKMIKATRLHPLNYLNAFVVHTEGQIKRDKNNPMAVAWGDYGREKNWKTSPVIRDALDAGVHLAFKSIDPTNKRTLLGVDVSGSMSSSIGMGIDLSAAQISGVMAATIAKTEPNYQIMGFVHEFRDLGISANMDLSSVLRRVQDNNFGRTDCALPMTWALRHKLEVDTFVVITDNETYAGHVHPHVALQDYRRKMGIPARLIVVGTTSTGFTIADPNDRGMLDVVGADANLPKLVAEFSKGEF